MSPPSILHRILYNFVTHNHVYSPTHHPLRTEHPSSDRGIHPLSQGTIADFSGPSRMTIGYLEEFIADGQVLEEPADLDAVFEKQASVLRAREEKRKLETEVGRQVAEGRLDEVLAR